MGMETTRRGIDDWIAVTRCEGDKIALPITLHTTSGSMVPAIRMNEDTVIVVPCGIEDVRVGDIVLMREADSSAGVLLHRLYRIRDGKLVTLGDNMRQPDREKDASALLGRAVSITGPGKSIDCDSRWRRLQGRLIVHGYPLRPAVFLSRGALRKARGLLRHEDDKAIGRFGLETQGLIYLVACAANRVAPEADLVAEMDLDALYQVASRHMLAATVAYALEAAGVQDKRFIHAKQHSALKNAQMDMEMDAVFVELDAAGIWHMPLKGIVLQHLYPVYGMREMSDHDILFDAGRNEDVKVIMEGLGFRLEHSGGGNHDIYYKPPVSNFEMHRELFYLTYEDGLYEYYEDIEKRLIGEGYEKHLTPEDFYLYIIAHEYKHYASGGTGLRSLLDTYMYLQKEKLDMAYVAAEAEKMGIAQFEYENRTLSQHLFSGGELTTRDQEMLNYILSSGVYGTFNHLAENEMSKHGVGKARYLLSRFFAPFNKKDRSYSFFVGEYPLFYKYKPLLPLLLFYRAFRTMKSGRFKSMMRAIKNA